MAERGGTFTRRLGRTRRALGDGTFEGRVAIAQPRTAGGRPSTRLGVGAVPQASSPRQGWNLFTAAEQAIDGPSLYSTDDPAGTFRPELPRRWFPVAEGSLLQFVWRGAWEDASALRLLRREGFEGTPETADEFPLKGRRAVVPSSRPYRGGFQFATELVGTGQHICELRPVITALGTTGQQTPTPDDPDPEVTGHALGSWTTFGTYTLSLDGSGAQEGDLLTIVMQHAYLPGGACGGDSEDSAQSVSGASQRYSSVLTGGMGSCRHVRFSVWTMTATQDHIDNGVTYTGGNLRVSNRGAIACIPIRDVSSSTVSADGPNTGNANVGPVDGGIIVFGTRQARSGLTTSNPTVSPSRELIFSHVPSSTDASPRIRAWFTDDTENTVAGNTDQAAAAAQFGVEAAVF